MDLIGWVQAHSEVFTVPIALASGYFAWSRFRVERKKDLPANHVHAWVTGHTSPLMITDEAGRVNDFRLQINIKNGSMLPIYKVQMKVKTTSRFIDSGFQLNSRKKIYIHEENVIVGNLNKVTAFLIRVEDIAISNLREYLLATHIKIDAEDLILEQLASHLAVEISFRDSSGKYWKRKSNGKLRRKYLRNY